MSYSPSEHVTNCERKVEQARLIAKHYPDAYREQRGDAWVWCHMNALQNATHFEVEVREKDGEQRAALCPYHLLEDGEIKIAVFATGWEGYCEDWDLRKRAEANPEIHAAIMALPKARQ